MSKKIVKNKESRFLNALIKATAEGKTISRKQARSNYRLGNPSATVLRFEQNGWKVKRHYTRIKIKLANGKTLYTRTVKYSIN